VTNSTWRRTRQGAGRGLYWARARLELRLDPRYRRLARRLEFPDGSQRIYCHHIRKTGGTSLHSSFIALGGEDPVEVQRRMHDSLLLRTISGGYVFAAERLSVLSEGSYFYAWSHRPAHEVRLPPNTFTVTVLRDPVTRVLSLFNYLVAGDDPTMPFQAPASERELAAHGLSSFLDRLPKRFLLRQLFTFSPAFDVAEAADRILTCSFSFHTESFDAGLAQLGERLTLPLRPRRDRASPRVAPPPSADELERLGEMLEPEYSLLQRLERIRS
jgi:hypothetical protein